MNNEEIKDFLRKHLKIAIDNETCCMRVRLLIDDEVIATSETFHMS